MDTGFCTYNDNTWEVSSDERKWINKILKLAEDHPDEVKITQRPESNYGMIVAHVPATWFKIMPPRKLNLTEEQRSQMAERLKAGREKL